MKQLWWFLAFVIAGCAAQLNPSGIAPLEDPILRAVLDALPLDTLKSRNRQSVRIDPRVFVPSDSLVVPDSASVLQTSHDELQNRIRIIRSNGFGLTDSVEDSRCMWSEGLSIWVAGDPRPEETADCRLTYVSVTLAAPRRGGSSFPGLGATSAPPGSQTVRVVAFSSDSHQVMDLTLIPGKGGEWVLHRLEMFISSRSAP